MADYRGQRFGNYQLIGLLGEGGYAQVYLGEQVFLKTRAAIKVLHAQLEDEKVEQFRLEGDTIARLDHPHIVRLLDYGVEHTTPYLVMDYAPNGTLRQRHPKGVAIPLATIIRYIQQIAAALEYAHQHKIIHRDVKPENLLLGRKNEVLLSDFGIAVVAHQATSMTTQDELGTINYMAPEQLRKRPHPASDQYALAVVVYEWLTGNSPFQGSPIEVAMQHLEAPPPPLRQSESSVSAEIEQVVLKALEKDQRQRFASVREFALALQEASFAHPSFACELAADSLLLSPAQVDPMDQAPTSAPLIAAGPPKASEVLLDEVAAQETRELVRRAGDQAPGDSKNEHSTGPTSRPPEPHHPPDIHHSRPRRLNRRKTLLAIVALLLLAILGAGGALLTQGSIPAARGIAAGPTATETQTLPQGATSSPGASATPPGMTRTTPATAITPTSLPTGSNSPTATTIPPSLAINPHSLTFSLQLLHCLTTNQPQTLTIQNIGGGALSWQATIQNPAYLVIDNSSGRLGPSGTSNVDVTVNCNIITVSTTDTIVFTSNGGNVTVSVTIILS